MSQFTNPYSPFIKLNIGDQLSLTWSKGNKSLGRQDGPDYFISLSNRRYVNQANTAEIVLSFNPDSDINSNFLENAIAAANGQCSYRYGTVDSISNTYVGQMTGYKVSFSEGNLRYTISVVSRAVIFNGKRIDSSAYDIPKYSSIKLGIVREKAGLTQKMVELRALRTLLSNYKKMSRIEYVKRLYSGMIDYGDSEKELDDFAKGIVEDNKAKAVTLQEKIDDLINSDDPDDHYIDEDGNNFAGINTPVDFVFSKIESIVNTFMDGYKFDRDNSVKDFTVPKSYDIVVNQLSGPVLALHHIADCLLYDGSGDNPESDKENSFTFYKIVIEDTIDTSGDIYGRVTLKSIHSPVNDIESAKTYKFEWGSRDSNVISWSPEYSGTYNIFVPDVDDPSYKEFNNLMSTTVNADGVAFEVIKNPPVPSEYDANNYHGSEERSHLFESVLYDTRKFCESVNYAYTAKMTVLGVSDKEIGNVVEEFIKVVPYINGSVHHSAGVYMVVGITDSVGSDGFTTSFDLIRSADRSKSYIASELQYYYDGNGDKHSIYESLQPLVYKEIDRENITDVAVSSRVSNCVYLRRRKYTTRDGSSYVAEEYYINIDKAVPGLSDTSLTVNRYSNGTSVSYTEEGKISDIVLVNKSAKINDDAVKLRLDAVIHYKEITDCTTDHTRLEDEVRDSLTGGWKDDVVYNGPGIAFVSRTRDISDQERIYNSYPESERDTYSARPRHSEHHTGLAYDLCDREDWNIDTFGDKESFTYVKDICWKYGFILRYPEGSEKYTGYMYEPWHIRYVGSIRLAKYIMDSGKSIEELFNIPSNYDTSIGVYEVKDEIVGQISW